MTKKALFVLTPCILMLLMLTIRLHPTAGQGNPPTVATTRQNNCCSKDDLGAIEGYVYDLGGQPVAGARVYAERMDVVSGRSIYSLTDDRGKFLLGEIPPGTYILYAAKEEDGFPKTTSTFHYNRNLPLQQIVVSQRQTVTNIGVQLGPKVPELALHVVDAETGKPVKSVQITLRHAGAADRFYSSTKNHFEEDGDDFKILAPIVPFTLSISAPGYEDWVYKNGSNALKPGILVLKQEEVKRVVVAMSPSK